MRELSVSRLSVPISVVIPAYNSAPFLRQAIESVRAQTLPVNEIVVVDDGSTDGSCSGLAGGNVTLIRQNNRGPSAARNAGIRRARNPWIALLDGDDLWHPDKIERQWSLVRACRDIGLVSCDHCTVRDGRILQPSYLNQLADLRTHAKAAQSDPAALCFGYIGKWFFDYGLVILPSTVLVRRKALTRAGLFDERLRGVEDYECFMRVLAITKFGIADRVLMQYRLHERNLHDDTALMQTNFKKMWDIVTANPIRYSPFLVPALQWIHADRGYPLSYSGL
jgi:glycosyltransferase involved in cell wall biosynthesis